MDRRLDTYDGHLVDTWLAGGGASVTGVHNGSNLSGIVGVNLRPEFAVGEKWLFHWRIALNVTNSGVFGVKFYLDGTTGLTHTSGLFRAFGPTSGPTAFADNTILAGLPTSNTGSTAFFTSPTQGMMDIVAELSLDMSDGPTNSTELLFDTGAMFAGTLGPVALNIYRSTR